MSIRRALAAVFVIAAVCGAMPLSAQSQPELPTDTSFVVSDWVQIKSQEWVKGRLIGMFDFELEFDSSEFDVRTWDWDDIVQVRTAGDVEVGLVTGEVVVGRLSINGPKVLLIQGDKPVDLVRSEIVTISPLSGRRKILRYWVAKVDVGLTVLAGNTDENDANISAKLKRQTKLDRFLSDYIANVSNSNDQKISNNQRWRVNWDRFITGRFFVKPLSGEWYTDPFQNINARNTAGAGAGYQIRQTPRTKWEVSGGLAYQQTRFANVEPGAEDRSQTGAFTGSTKLEYKWTKAVKLTYEYAFNMVNEQSGRYTHHMYGLVETNWTKALDLDLTVIWDRTQHPQPGANGVVPKPDDFRMVVSLGIDF